MIESSENKLIFTVGTERVFNFPILFYDRRDIRCYIRINDSERMLNDSEFSIEAKEDYSSGATVTLLIDPLPVGATLAIQREIAFDQLTQLPNNGKLPAKILEKSLDKLTMLCQQLKEKIARALTVDITATDVNIGDLKDSFVTSALEAAESAGEAAIHADNSAKAATLAERYKTAANTAALKSMGIPIGTIYPCLGNHPPDGAFLLNGQTIENCRRDYPEFWNYIAGGESAGIPVYKEFVMPVLTEDGTPGGDHFASRLEGDGIDLRGAAYMCFDGKSNSYPFVTLPADGAVSVIFYSPKLLKIESVDFTGDSLTRFRALLISASRDNVSWDPLYNEVAPEGYIFGGTALLPSPAQPYNYYKFTFQNRLDEVNHSYLPKEITLHGEELDHIIPSGVEAAIITNEEYEAQIDAYGVCGGVVINEESGSVRLPTWGYQAQLPATLKTRGNGTALGITDGVNFMGLEMASGALHAYTSLYDTALGTVPATKTGGANALGVTFDPDASGLVTEVATSPTHMFPWVIQVFNAPVPLSTQQAYALASALQTKAQTDLANVDSNIDYVVESWKDGSGGWYRKYRSGWVEQGGYTPSNTGVNTITLLVEMADANYSALISYSCTGDSTDTDGATSCPVVSDRTTTSIRINQTKKSNDSSYWEVKGDAATE